jgi:hypothetical protein
MSSPFAAVPMLFLSPPDSKLLALLEEAHELVERQPQVLRAIDQDLDRHGKLKKALRQQDAQWREARSLGLPTVGWEPAAVLPEDLRLEVGRPRTSAYVVYMFLVGRGYYGGFKSSDAMTLLQESTTLTVLLASRAERMPGLSTLNELVNAVSNDTRETILNAQLAEILNEKWDDFSTLLVDSTAVEGNTQWPKESHLMVRLVARVLYRGSNLGRLELPDFEERRARKLLGKMNTIDKQISMEAGKPGSSRTRKQLYVKLLRMARRALSLLEPHVRHTEHALESLDVEPSRRQMAARLVGWLRVDLGNLARVIHSCDARVVQGRKVPVEEKVLSVSDSDVGFIAKGGREPVVGYKPQLGRSGAGFVTALNVPLGNAADSGQLVPMFEQHVERTGAIPSTVSVDDGYSSALGRAHLLQRGVKVASISGSKGKHITPLEQWNDLDYVAARDGRSAVESLMFTIKHGFDFGRVARRGLESVRAELLEKVLAYNFCRMAGCRRNARDHERLAA